ncbi:L,D-transpeptidase [Sphingomonas sp. TREG-RG-20F-R18-01]|uniref:L,D-transpeptidase n=1 Tax=Sphingomonas sp. TREG-RG-20F-R18-01 TaxID=2914982 RepID=UPI001F5763C9|nr:L,D-transpeptidase [Sphingomonas sp. TREG-RG-20F-R18-01]
MASDDGTPPVRALVSRIMTSGDNHARPFLIVDKVAARVFAFDASGKLRDTSPALLGAARGDVPPAGIGTRTLAQIGPADRITQAGRFEAHMGRDLHEDVLWIDYDSGLSLHRVVTTSRSEHRLTRLATPTTDDNRVSFGCINVPRIFYETVVAPLFRPADGTVYILPEQKSVAATFPTLTDAMDKAG